MLDNASVCHVFAYTISFNLHGSTRKLKDTRRLVHPHLFVHYNTYPAFTLCRTLWSVQLAIPVLGTSTHGRPNLQSLSPSICSVQCYIPNTYNSAWNIVFKKYLIERKRDLQRK